MSQKKIAERIIDQLIESSIEATPRVVASILLLFVSVIVFRRISSRINGLISKPCESERERRIVYLVIKSLATVVLLIVTLFILGFGRIATILGTLSGVAILAVSYAMRNAVKELVSGLYLINDDDFVKGNKVSVNGITGHIAEVGVRRTRIEQLDGSITTISNTKIEPRWTYIPED